MGPPKFVIMDPDSWFSMISMFFNPELFRICECVGACSTSSPGGNLVDGLQPVAHSERLNLNRESQSK